MATTMAVSYTHLDVYKRQVWQTPAPGAGQTMEFDITDLVNGWITVTEPPLGLMFRSEIEADGGAYAMKAEVLCNRGDSVNGPQMCIRDR